MKFIVSIDFLHTAVFEYKPAELAARKSQGAISRQPNECVEPYYCLKLNGATEYTCEMKTCLGQDHCRMGQYCNESINKYDVEKCVTTADCPSNSICRMNGFCNSRATVGEKCNRNDQCWGDCVNGKCTRPSLSFQRGFISAAGPDNSTDAATSNWSETQDDSPEESAEPESTCWYCW